MIDYRSSALRSRGFFPLHIVYIYTPQGNIIIYPVRISLFRHLIFLKRSSILLPANDVNVSAIFFEYFEKKKTDT